MKKVFTLIEVLAVMAVIAILASLLIPNLGRARDAARTAVCASRQKQVALASQLYMNLSKNRFFSPNNTETTSGDFIGNYVDKIFQEFYGERLGRRDEGHKVFTCPLSPKGEPETSTDTRWQAFATRTVDKNLSRPEINYYLYANASDTWMFGDGYRIDWQASIFRMNEENQSRDDYGYPHMRHNKGKATVLTYLDGHTEVTKWSKLKELQFKYYVPYGNGSVANPI